MANRFVCEPIKPVTGSMAASVLARGEPAAPERFVWGDTEYAVAEVLGAWRETSPCKSGGDEQYARKHWFHVRTTDGAEMKLYFERQPRSKRQRTTRWWLHSVSTKEPSSNPE